MKSFTDFIVNEGRLKDTDIVKNCFNYNGDEKFFNKILNKMSKDLKDDYFIIAQLQSFKELLYQLERVYKNFNDGSKERDHWLSDMLNKI